MAAQGVADESLLYGTQERREELYGAQAGNGEVKESSSGSASASVERLEYAPPPPPLASQPPQSVQAGVDHWTTLNTGVLNLDGSQSTDMGFNILNEQYNGNTPMSTAGNRSAGSMDWMQVPAFRERLAAMTPQERMAAAMTPLGQLSTTIHLWVIGCPTCNNGTWVIQVPADGERQDPATQVRMQPGIMDMPRTSPGSMLLHSNHLEPAVHSISWTMDGNGPMSTFAGSTMAPCQPQLTEVYRQD